MMNAKSVGRIRRQHQLLCDTVVKKNRNLYGDKSQMVGNQSGPLPFGAASPLDMINLQIMNYDFATHGDEGDKTRALLGAQLIEAQNRILQGAMFPFSSAEVQADQMKLLNIL